MGDKACVAKAVGSRVNSPRVTSPRGVNPISQSQNKQMKWPCQSPTMRSRGARPGSAPATPAPQPASGCQRTAQFAHQLGCNAPRGQQSPKPSGTSSTPVPGFLCTSQMLQYLGLETPSVSASMSSDEDELESTSIYEHATPREGDSCSTVLSSREDSTKPQVADIDLLTTNTTSQSPVADGDVSKGSIDADLFAESRVDFMLGATQGLLQALNAAVNPRLPGSDCRSPEHSGSVESAALVAAAEGKLPQATVIPATAGTPSTSTPTSASSLGTTTAQLLDDLRFRVSHLELEFQRLQRSDQAQSCGGEPLCKPVAFQQLLDAFHQQVGGICKQQAEVTQDLQHLRENIGGLASQVSSLPGGGAGPETGAAGAQEEVAKHDAVEASSELSEKAAAPQASRLRTRSGSHIPVLLSGNLGNLTQAVALDGIVSARLPGSLCAPVGSAGRQAALLRSRFSTGSLPATPSVPQRYQHTVPFPSGHGVVRRLPSAPLHMCPTAVRAG